MRHTFIAVILTIASLVFTASGFSQTTLNNGQMVIGLSGSTSSQRTYRITVPTGQTKLEVKTYGGSGDADLYVKRGALPTTSSYDLSGQSGSNTETVTMYNPSPGDWFILVRAYAAYSNLTLVAAYTGPVAAAAVATPVINPGSQSTMSAVTVSMSSATSGATIRYTTNGSDPTSSSTIYGGAFTLSTSATVKARAFKSGMTDSAVATTSYTISIPSGPANNNFGSRAAISSGGGTVSGSNVNATKESGEPSHAGNAGGKSVWWTWTPSASGSATIKTLGSSFDTTLAIYTGGSVSGLAQVFNGGNDDYSGNTSQVTISVSAGVAYQIAVDGFNGASGSITLAVTAPVVVAAAVATPVINPGSQSTMSAVTVSMSSATSGASIRYTTNGSDPNSSSTAYVGAFTLSTSATVKARAFKSGMLDSAVATTSYTISIPSGPANNNFASRAAISSAGGTVGGSNANATKESGEPSHAGNAGGRSVWWTWTPSVSGSATIKTLGSSFDTTLAVYTGGSVSGLAQVFNGGNDDYNGNTSQVIISVSAGVAYQIAVDGFNGASGSITLAVTAPVVVAAAVATPVINPGSQSTMSAVTVSMSSATSGATIRYTTNGSDPTSGSTAYVGAFPLSTSATVKARAFKSGMTDSGVATTSYTISIPSGPANNNFGSRMTITSAGGVVSGSNANATKESGEPSHASNAGGRSVWWTWTPSASGRATISTAGSSFDTLLAVYTGSAVSALTPVPLGSNDDFGSSNTSQINIAVTAGVAYQIAVDGFSGSSGSISLTVTTETPVVLLLHGMNSDPFTWNSFISDPAYFNYAPYIVPSVPTIYAGVIQGQGFPPQPATPDNKGVRYYRVKFGQYDRNPGRTGLENVVSTSSQGESGDFSSFTNHADEVRDAIANIRTSFANAKILLVGHSRGGIAGRSFLQGAASSAERNAVAGLLTVGTPHLGSPLGRIYQFLKDNPRTTSNDWRLVDELRGAAGYGAYKNSLDVRRPTIGDLASGPGLPNPPSPIDLLAQGTGNLPVGIKYGTVQFDGQAFGVVHNEPTGVQSGFVSVFFGGGAGPYTFSALTDAARNYIVSGTSIAANRGDGIVPFASQTFSGSGISVTPFANTQGILHTKEPEQKIDIRTAMKGLVNWWN